MDEYLSPVALIILLNVLFLACVAVLAWIIGRRRAARSRSSIPQNPRPTLRVRLSSWWRPRVQPLRQSLQHLPWKLWLELALIALWAIYVGRAYLDTTPSQWPMGREFGIQVQTHYLWERVKDCGWCALWNGNINGGAPALADMFGSMAHPVVMVTTLIWGVMGGAKIALIVSLWMAGVAQWWMARTLKLGLVARMWSSLLVVVGAHLAARMENGNFGLVLSTAACSLALAAAFELGVAPQRRSMPLLALTGAMAVVSGQGYLQFSLLCWGPAVLFLILNDNFKPRPIWKSYALAVGLSILITSVFWVPAMHFGANAAKETTSDFSAGQPLEYIPLNLVIRDGPTILSDTLGREPFGYMYNLFVGWVPILLALSCLALTKRKDRRAILFLACGMFTMFFLASGAPLRLLAPAIPSLYGFRFTPLFAGLAIPALLCLAAYGLEQILALNWPTMALRFGDRRAEPKAALDLRWILIIPLVGSIYTAYDMGQGFLVVQPAEQHYTVISALETPSTQWVSPPFGEFFWDEPALNSNFKLTNVVWAWHWKDREPPKPYLWADRNPAPPEFIPTGALLGDLPVYHDPQANYAYIDNKQGRQPCTAHSRGGDIQVTCTSDTDGQLVVEENTWDGWIARRDGSGVTLRQGTTWLTVDAPAGTHTYEFYYRPWDAVIGLIGTLVGLGLTSWLWLRPPDRLLPIEPSDVIDTP